MQILLVAATQLEIKLFNNNYSNVDILVTGVGVPATIYHLQKKLHEAEYDYVIQVGIAGAFSNELDLGETVLVKQDTFGDLGIVENNIFTPATASGLIAANNFPFAAGWLINAAGIPKNAAFKAVKAVTVNKVSDDNAQKQQLINAFNPQIETMEGAALHYVCLMEEISFVQIRSISNYVGERNKGQWKIDEAVENLNAALITLINQFNC